MGGGVRPSRTGAHGSCLSSTKGWRICPSRLQSRRVPAISANREEQSRKIIESGISNAYDNEWLPETYGHGIWYDWGNASI